MIRFPARFLVTVTVVAGLSAVARAGEPAAVGVVDNEGLFRSATVAQADELIRGLRRDYHFDVRIETATLPEAERKGTGGLVLRHLQARHFAEIGRERADKADVNGLYVLICTAPVYNQVTVYPKSAGALFSRYQQRLLEKLLDDRLQGVRPGVGRNDRGRGGPRPRLGATAGLQRGQSAARGTGPGDGGLAGARR